MRTNQYKTIYNPISTDYVCIVGDTHGIWDILFEKIDSCEIRNCVLIHVGDVGIGFKSPEKQNSELEIVNDYFSERGISFYAIAGNHDDPSYFQGQVNLSHFTLLADYSTLIINHKKFLFVGGATSIDRILRTPNKSWWPDEVFVLDESRAEKCDVLITHTAPNWIGPNDKNGLELYIQKDATLWDECLRERIDMNQLIKLTQPQKHFCGHFHISQLAENDSCRSRIMNEHELCEITL
jgi:UDP-2,3-diacylglucosamine pyrophosphatase LpxH